MRRAEGDALWSVREMSKSLLCRGETIDLFPSWMGNEDEERDREEGDHNEPPEGTREAGRIPSAYETRTRRYLYPWIFRT